MVALIKRPADGWGDKQRYDFLMSLDERAEVEVSDWEASFLESVCDAYETYHGFTERQRKVIDRMADTYGI